MKVEQVPTPAPVSKQWLHELTEQLYELRLWLSNPINVDETIEELADLLVSKHHDYGEQNLIAFGELGILVRSSDKIARLKNLLDRPGVVTSESREDTWRDLAGYAIQALILMKRSPSVPKMDLFEVRRNRLIRGFCPDCGEGVLLRRQQWAELPFRERVQVRIFCSAGCGFDLNIDLFDIDHDTTEVIHKLAAREAVEDQKL